MVLILQYLSFKNKTSSPYMNLVDPQKSVPSISAVGYNGGKLLWQHVNIHDVLGLMNFEGYVSAENLVADIEKALASLRLQETTATVLMAAALSSQRPDRQSSDAINAVSPEQGSSSSNQVPDSSMETSTQTSEVKIPVSSVTIEENVCSEATAEKCSYPHEDTTSKATYCSENKHGNDERSISTSETSEMPSNPSIVDVVKSDIESGYSMDRDGSSGAAPANNGQEFSRGTSKKSVNEHEGSIHEKKSDGMISSGDAIRPSDVHLNIRLPDGGSLQAKFSITATLRMVKNYVDENKMSGKGAYNLAIPYPRKLFDEQDMSKALSELGFFNREALIVVPHRSVSGSSKGQTSFSGNPSSVNNPDSSVDNGGGNFAYLKRLLSYMNPLSYFGGSANPSSSEPAPNNDMWQYRPNPSLRSALSGTNRSYHPYSANSGIPPVSDNSNNSNNSTTRKVGSNIHTLNHDQDDGPSGDRNNFWNGNSTQYGGNDNK
ncbi:hypothetical protein ACLOJK_011930 [Asimina triloba]